MHILTQELSRNTFTVLQLCCFLQLQDRIADVCFFFLLYWILDFHTFSVNFGIWLLLSLEKTLYYDELCTIHKHTSSLLNSYWCCQKAWRCDYFLIFYFFLPERTKSVLKAFTEQLNCGLCQSHPSCMMVHAKECGLFDLDLILDLLFFKSSRKFALLQVSGAGACVFSVST